MKENFTIWRFLTDIDVCILIFAIFLSFVVIPFKPCRADDDANSQTNYVNAPQVQDNPLNDDDKLNRTHMLVNYVRKEIPALMPGLPGYIRDPSSWAMGRINDVRNQLGLEPGASGGDESVMASVIEPVSEMMQSPSTQQSEATWVSPGYHHMGFLPFHDAMVMGVGARHTLLDSRVQTEVRPFYAESWYGRGGYGGTEMAVNLSGFGIGDGKPWGKIAVRYLEGDQDMLDHGHGTDMHAELRFSQRLAFHAGVREDGDNGGLGNYAMLRWQLAEFGPAR